MFSEIDMGELEKLNIINDIDMYLYGVILRDITRDKAQLNLASSVIVKTADSLIVLKHNRGKDFTFDDFNGDIKWEIVNKTEFCSGVTMQRSISCMETHIVIDKGFYHNKHFIVDIS